jgi:hypothetical protein
VRPLRLPQLQGTDLGIGNTNPNKEMLMSPKFAPVLFGFVLSALMSFVVSGIATFRSAGLIDGFFPLWISAWLPSWLIAFPVVLVVAPIARRFVDLLVKAPAAPAR